MVIRYAEMLIRPGRLAIRAGILLAFLTLMRPQSILLMTDDQHAKLAAYGAVETVLDAHPDALASIPAAQRAIDDFRRALRDLRGAAQDQTAYAPQGTAKDARLDALTAAAVPIAQAVAAWAEDKGDVALADQIAFTRSDFRRSRDQDALDRAALVHATAAHVADLADYGVSPGALTALDAHIDSFATALTQPRHAIAERVAHTGVIERLFPEIDRILGRRLDRFVEALEGTPFYDEYHAARRIVDR
jgi:hypothetical protein